MKRLLFAAALLAACARPAGFPGYGFDTLAAGPAKACSTERCLYVYVAPWCGVCRGSTGMLREFTAFLNGRGIDAFTIVGMDLPGRVKEYAAEFGPDTLLDPMGRAPTKGGVPQLIVTDREGKVLERQNGMYLVLESPVPEFMHVWQAAKLHLIDQGSQEAQEAAAVVNQLLAQRPQ